MIKFIHCADVHLGSKMEAKLPKNKSEERRAEVRTTFHRMVEYAKKEGVRAILLAGDVFDSDRPLKRDKEFFYSVVRNTPEIDFLYLRGNHDGEQSYVESFPNLKTFSENWSAYDYGDVTVSGIELSRGNALSLYSTLRLDGSRINIVMLHGQISSAAGVDKVYLNALAEKHIDYLALGHLHSYSENRLDDRGRYAYSGCLEGRGFDECGTKGFVLLEVDGDVKSSFIPFAARTIEEVSVDVTGATDSYAAYQLARRQVKLRSADLYRIELRGNVDFEHEYLAADVAGYLSNECYFVSVKDKTLRRVHPEQYKGDISLRGEFVRRVLDDPTWSEEYKSRIIELGLKALGGEEVEG